MALTVFETTEQQFLPCQQGGGGDGGKAAAAGAEKAAATMLKETDHGGDDDRPERVDIWNMIQQAQKPPAAVTAAPRQAAQAPYVHPLVRRSSSLLTQKSLEICTESLGSETGSDGFSDADSGSGTDRSSTGSDGEREEEEEEEVVVVAAPRSPPPSRAFPPPLPSLARRKVVESTMEMRQERQDGRLLVRVVPVPSSTLFRAQRRGGRLLLSFADTAAPAPDDQDRMSPRVQALEPEPEHEHEQQALVDEEDDEVEDEVEVVDRGTVVEFKVSTQPQPRSGGGPRVHRSALVINKFVGAEPVTSCDIDDGTAAPPPHAHAHAHAQHPAKAKPPRRSTGPTTTAVAALAAASALTATAAPPGDGDDGAFPGATCGENKLLMTAKRRSSKEDLMKHMRCSGKLSGPLFVWEGYIATSS